MEITVYGCGPDEAVLFEPSQRLTQRYLADAEFGRQRILSHWGLRGDLTAQYAVANGAVNLLRQCADNELQSASFESFPRREFAHSRVDEVAKANVVSQ